MAAGIEWPKTWHQLVDLVKQMEDDPEAYLHRGELRQALEAVKDDDSLGVGEKKRAALERVAGLAADGERLRVRLELFDPEEHERAQAAVRKYTNSRRALDQNRADQLAGETETTRERDRRNEGLREFIEQAHANNVPKELILEQLMEEWGWTTEEEKLEDQYRLSAETLGKWERGLRGVGKGVPGWKPGMPRGKAPGRG